MRMHSATACQWSLAQQCRITSARAASMSRPLLPGPIPFAVCRLGRRILRPLLRAEIGEVFGRRAWHRTAPAAVQELYKAPLRIENWDLALTELCRRRRDIRPADLLQLYQDVAWLPALVVAGRHDRLISPAKAKAVAAELPGCSQMITIPHCGNLSHEECPDLLLEHMSSFVLSSLKPQ